MINNRAFTLSQIFFFLLIPPVYSALNVHGHESPQLLAGVSTTTPLIALTCAVRMREGAAPTSGSEQRRPAGVLVGMETADIRDEKVKS